MPFALAAAEKEDLRRFLEGSGGEFVIGDRRYGPGQKKYSKGFLNAMRPSSISSVLLAQRGKAHYRQFDSAQVQSSKHSTIVTSRLLMTKHCNTPWSNEGRN